MPRTRLDGTGQVTIQYENGSLTWLLMKWKENLELADASDEMTEPFNKTFDISSLSVGDQAKIDTALTVLRGIRNTQFPI